MVEEEPSKPVEEAENVELVEGDPSKTTKVGKELQSSKKASSWKEIWMSLHGSMKICQGLMVVWQSIFSMST